MVPHGQGAVECVKRDPNDPNSLTVFSMRLQTGDYFGELALLTDQPRQASVIAVGHVKLLSIGKKHFSQVMGPVEALLKSKITSYATYEQLIASQPSPLPTTATSQPDPTLPPATTERLHVQLTTPTSMAKIWSCQLNFNLVWQPQSYY